MKISDKERLEPPHVTIIKGRERWRYCLRTQQFLDRDPDPRDVPSDLMDVVTANIDDLRREWDAMYPGNPVCGSHDDE